MATDASDFITLTRSDLDRLLSEAVARGVAQATSVSRSEWLDNAQAARLFYGRDDRVLAFRALRYRYPEIDAASVGRHRLRRWRRADLDALIAGNPCFAGYAKRYGTQPIPVDAIVSHRRPAPSVVATDREVGLSS